MSEAWGRRAEAALRDQPARERLILQAKVSMPLLRGLAAGTGER